MTAHAYSGHSRRYAKIFASTTTTKPTQKPKTNTAVSEFTSQQNQLVAFAPQKNHSSLILLTSLTVAIVHTAIGWHFLNQLEPKPIKAEIPPITVEFYRPPAEQLPEPPKVEAEPPRPTPKPLAEKPEKVADRPQMVPAEKTPEPVPIIAPAPPEVTYIPEHTPQPEPAREPPPVLTKASADAAYLRNPAPRYPDVAFERGWEGTVILSVHVLSNGKPKVVEIHQSSGRKVLDDAAIQAVRRWSFVPAKLGEHPTESWVEVPVDFKLSS